MKKKRKSLNIDLSFLDDKDSLKTKQANSITSNKELDSSKRESNSSKAKWMNILIFSIIGLFFIFLIISNISSDNNTPVDLTRDIITSEIDDSNKTDDIDTLIVFDGVGNENLRECPSFDCDVIQYGAMLSRIEIIESSGEWYKVNLIERGYFDDNTSQAKELPQSNWTKATGWMYYTLIPEDIISKIDGSVETKKDNIDSIVDPKMEDKVEDMDVPIIPKTKSNKEICIDNHGVYSYSTGDIDSNGDPICGCLSGYMWNVSKTICVIVPVVPKTNDQICEDTFGNKSHYTGKKGDNGGPICDCISGYDWNTARTSCIDLTVARDQSCAKSYPGTSFLEYSEDGETKICDCISGYHWNNDRTACYTIDALNNSCIDAYGTGSYSYIQNNKRVCGCEYSYDWNIDRTSCVTTASINVICERDVGRNSRYAGYVEDGVYICTDPY